MSEFSSNRIGSGGEGVICPLQVFRHGYKERPNPEISVGKFTLFFSLVSMRSAARWRSCTQASIITVMFLLHFFSEEKKKVLVSDPFLSSLCVKVQQFKQKQGPDQTKARLQRASHQYCEGVEG